MIKTWHKWFVCVFVVLFMGVYFFVDASFFYKEPTDVKSDIVLDEDFLEEEEQEQAPSEGEVGNGDGTNTEEEPKEEVEKIPSYKNAYTCLSDAYERFDAEKYYEFTQISEFTSLKQTQNFKTLCKYSDGLFSCEGFVYSDSSFGKKYYERTTAYDKQTITHIKSDKIDSSYNYDLSSLTLNDVESYDEKFDYYMDHKFTPFFFRAKKGRDKQIRFDKDSNSKYYIISIMFDTDSVSELYSSIIMDNAGASSLTFTSAIADYYISKTTGKIVNFVARENYSMVLPAYLNMKLDVEYQTKIEFTYYDAPIDVVIK